MPASTDDILTAIKNIVVALNAQTASQLNVDGLTDFFNVTSATLIKPTGGRIVRISVVVAGSAAGTVYDATSVTDLTRPIYKITFAATGIQEVNIPCQYGILVVPGTGQTLAGSYS